MPRRRVWCETLPLSELADPALLRSLARHGIDVLAAVRPDDLPRVAPLLSAARAGDVTVGLWPMLDDREGRWASAHNHTRFDAFVDETLRAAAPHPVAELALDLEPPIGLVSAWLGTRGATALPAGPLRAALGPAHATLRRRLDATTERGVAVSAAVIPMVVLDDARAAGWQRLLSTPVDHLPWSHVSVMAYTTMFEGWSGGALGRADARWMLATCCRRARARYGAAAGISLGAVGIGALGNEPIYRSPEELRDDVAVAVAEGIDTLTLFDLAGALRRPPLEAWLEALCNRPEAVTVRPTIRAQALLAGAKVFGRLPW